MKKPSLFSIAFLMLSSMFLFNCSNDMDEVPSEENFPKGLRVKEMTIINNNNENNSERQYALTYNDDKLTLINEKSSDGLAEIRFSYTSFDKGIVTSSRSEKRKDGSISEMELCEYQFKNGLIVNEIKKDNSSVLYPESHRFFYDAKGRISSFIRNENMNEEMTTKFVYDGDKKSELYRISSSGKESKYKVYLYNGDLLSKVESSNGEDDYTEFGYDSKNILKTIKRVNSGDEWSYTTTYTFSYGENLIPSETHCIANVYRNGNFQYEQCDITYQFVYEKGNSNFTFIPFSYRNNQLMHEDNLPWFAMED